MRWSLVIWLSHCCPLFCCGKNEGGGQGNKKKATPEHHHHEAERNHHHRQQQQQQQGENNNLDDDNNKKKQQQHAERIIQRFMLSMKKRNDEKKWRLERAEAIIQNYMISDATTTKIIPTYAEWSRQQDIEIAIIQKKQFAYYGPIGGSERFVFFQNRVKVCHCFTNSELDLGPTKYSVVDLQMLPQEKKQYFLWIQQQQQQQQDRVLEEKDISFRVTGTSIGTVIKATNPQTGDMIDLTDYDWW